MKSFRLIILNVTLICLPGSIIAADIAEKDVVPQRKAAAESMKVAVSGDATSIETKHLLIYSTVSKDKLDPIAEIAEKTFDYAYETLKFEDKDVLWPGKLTIYYLPDRKDYVAFSRLIDQNKPDKSEYSSTKLRGNEPYVLLTDNPQLEDKDINPSLEVGMRVAAALLDRKSGANAGAFSLPAWFRDGFGRLMAIRGQKNVRYWNLYKATVKKNFTRAKLGTFTADKVWEGGVVPERHLLEASLVEFLAYGPVKDKFLKFLAGMKPTNENQTDADLANAWMVIEVDPKNVDIAWKKWVITN